MTVSLKFTFKVTTLSLRTIEQNADRDLKVDSDFLYIALVNLTYLRNLLPNSDFKLVQTPDTFYASTKPTRAVLEALLRVVLAKYWSTRLVVQTTASISPVAKFALSKTLRTQLTTDVLTQ